MRTILFLLPSGLTIRNLLFTGVAANLLARDEVRVVVVTCAADVAEQYQQVDRLIFERFPPGRTGLPARVVHAVLNRRFCKMKETGSGRILSEGPLSRSWRDTLVASLLGQPFPRSKMLYEWIRLLEGPATRISPQVRELFTRYRPDLVVSTNPTTMSEYEFLKYARATGVTSVGIVKSWDVLTMRGYIPVPLDYYLVWNAIMKRDLMRLHDVAEDRLGMTGVPQFDIYADRSTVRPRDPVLRSLGLDPAKKTVLFATSSPLINPDDAAILCHLSDALRGEAVQILARLHPLDAMGRYGDLTRPNLVFHVPGASLGIIGDRRLLDAGFMAELRDTLLHCDVIVNTSSTMSLDAAALDRPVVNIGFDLAPKEYPQSRRRYYDLDHYRPIVESGATRIAWTRDEFAPLIRRYLDHPELEREQRAGLRDTMCYRVDGRSAQRMAVYLIRALEKQRFTSQTVASGEPVAFPAPQQVPSSFALTPPGIILVRHGASEGP